MNRDEINRLPRVIDCLGTDFEEACGELATGINGYCTPDLWLGVETGGAHMLRTMLSLGQVKGPCAFVKASRPDTGQKQNPMVSALLARLPRPVSNALRVTEHLIRERRFEKSRQASRRNVSLPGEALAKIRTATVVALIDDAIDSGSSIVQIIDAINAVAPSCKIVVAVIVQTFSNPLRSADVCLRHHELVRFPWSADAAG